MTIPTPALQECPRKQELVDAIRGVMDHILGLNHGIMQSVIKGDTATLEELRAQFSQARTQKDALLEAYKQHSRVHGC